MPLPVILGAVRAAAGAVSGAASGGAAIGGAARNISSALSGGGTLAEKAMVIGKNVESGLKPIVDGMSKFANTTTNVGQAAQGLAKIGKGLAELPLAPVKMFIDTVGAMGKVVGEVASVPIKLMTQAVMAIQAPVLVVADSLKGFVGAVGAMGSAVSDFVKLASPVEVLKFNMAMEDLTASIGKILLPVLEMSTAFVRAFADVIFKLADPLQNLMAAFFDPLADAIPELVDAMSPFIEIFSELANVFAQIIKPIMEALIPVIVNVASAIASIVAAVSLPLLVTLFSAVAGAVIAVIVALSPLIAILAAVGWAIKKAFFFISDALGLGGTKASGSSVGAAVRPATIGSVEDYGKKAQQAAFSLGTAAGRAEDRTASGIDKLVAFFTDGSFWTRLRKAILPGPDIDKTIDSAKEAAPRPGLVGCAARKENSQRCSE